MISCTELVVYFNSLTIHYGLYEFLSILISSGLLLLTTIGNRISEYYNAMCNDVNRIRIFIVYEYMISNILLADTYQ